jgi:hypothetical protein
MAVSCAVRRAQNPTLSSNGTHVQHGFAGSVAASLVASISAPASSQSGIASSAGGSARRLNALPSGGWSRFPATHRWCDPRWWARSRSVHSGHDGTVVSIGMSRAAWAAAFPFDRNAEM